MHTPLIAFASIAVLTALLLPVLLRHVRDRRDAPRRTESRWREGYALARKIVRIGDDGTINERQDLRIMLLRLTEIAASLGIPLETLLSQRAQERADLSFRDAKAKAYDLDIDVAIEDTEWFDRTVILDKLEDLLVTETPPNTPA